MTDQSRFVSGVISRAMSAIGSALGGAAFVWRAWMGGNGDDPTQTVMYGLIGFMLILTGLHVGVRGFGEPMPARGEGGRDYSRTMVP